MSCLGYVPVSREEELCDEDPVVRIYKPSRPRWVCLMHYALCVAIPLLMVAFALRDVNLRLRQAETSWRLDTSKNYTMNVDYWRRAAVGQERHYYFKITSMVELKPDGIARNLTVINGQYPGPLIEANAGDVLFIHVENHMKNEPVTIHCHGLFFGHNDSYNDGAAYINQCPIQPGGGNYTYRIELDKNQWGTYWYHSHFSTQAADGVFGPLVIHSNEELKQISEKYDEDMVIMVNDYYHDVASTYLDEYLAEGNENEEPAPDNGLIQGSGRFDFDAAEYIVPHGLDNKHTSYSPVPLPAIHLKPGKKYRIRLINAGFFVPFNFAIDQHKLKVIEADGTLVDPVELETITMSVGQRYSMFLERQDTELDRYWLHARFNPFCLKTENDNFETDVRAIVVYGKGGGKGGAAAEPTSTTWEFHGDDVICRDTDQSMFTTRHGSVPLRADGSRRPDVSVSLDVKFLIKERQRDRGYFNDVSYRPLRDNCTMYKLAFEAQDNSLRALSGDLQRETKVDGQYLINLDRRGDVIDLYVNNFDDGAHPFHLHGHKFWVLMVGEKGYFQDSYYDDDNGPMNFENPVLRDTVNINGFGFAILRFVVDNPGVWPFHCHIGWHMEAGLLLQINSLQSEYSEWAYPHKWATNCL